MNEPTEPRNLYFFDKEEYTLTRWYYIHVCTYKSHIEYNT